MFLGKPLGVGSILTMLPPLYGCAVLGNNRSYHLGRLGPQPIIVMNIKNLSFLGSLKVQNLTILVRPAGSGQVVR